MVIHVYDPVLEERLKSEREATGTDRYDEVWEGVLVMPPLANTEHQLLATRLAIVIHAASADPSPPDMYVGVNVSDREDEWEHNYRIPDVAVVFPGSLARNCGTHLLGGPDFVVEITSPHDRSREKVAFYSGIGVREFLIIDRNPWGLELFGTENGQLVGKGQCNLANPIPLVSSVLPVFFRLVPGSGRALIEVTHRDGVHRWLV